METHSVPPQGWNHSQRGTTLWGQRGWTPRGWPWLPPWRMPGAPGWLVPRGVKETEDAQHREGSSACPQTRQLLAFPGLECRSVMATPLWTPTQPIWEPNTHSPQLIHPHFNSLLTCISRNAVISGLHKTGKPQPQFYSEPV